MKDEDALDRAIREPSTSALSERTGERLVMYLLQYKAAVDAHIARLTRPPT